MSESVRCPYCGGLMECCTRYVREGLYGEPDMVYQYVCTECGSGSPPVKPTRGWYSCGGGSEDRFLSKAKRQAMEKAVNRKSKFDDAVIFGGGE